MKCVVRDSCIDVVLPITTPTGKVRVKRPVVGAAAEPVPCCSDPMTENDYLEWQISYDTDDVHDPSVLKDVVLQKPGTKVRYGCELVRLLVESRKIGILSLQTFNEMKRIVFAPLEKGIEESELVERREDKALESLATQHGFRRFYLLVPNYIKRTESYAVEIKIAHKQRAVGNQAMIYVHLPLVHCSSAVSGAPLVGRRANKLEEASYRIDSSNASLLTDTVVAFAVASVRHRMDMRLIFEAICSC